MKRLQNHTKYMARGGKRKGAGRKSGWVHSETTVIRVPKVFSDQLIEIAQKLDTEESLDSVSKSGKSFSDFDTESLVQLISDWKIKANNASPKSSRWIKARQLLSEIQLILDGKEDIPESKKMPAQLDIPVNESVTKSNDIEERSLLPLTGKGLSKRLGLARTAAWDARKRCAGSAKEFFEWSKERDPDGVGWTYNEQTKKYLPATEIN